MSGEDEDQSYEVSYLDGPLERTTWISRAGKARVTYQNGDMYEGLFNADKKRHGEGVYTWRTETGESRFEGTYVQGVREGYGVMRFANGEEYQGLWSKDKRNGQGTYRYANGDVFSGMWVEDKKHGNGAYVYGNKAQIAGDWRNGDLVRGKWIMPEYSSYHGNFKQGRPVGECIFVHANGNLQQGEFLEETSEDADEDVLPPVKFVGGSVEGLPGHAKDYASGSTSTLPAEDFILPLPRPAKATSPLLKEEEELTQLFQDIVAAKENSKPEDIDGQDQSEGKEEQPESSSLQKVSIQEMTEMLQKAAEGEEMAVYGNLLTSVPAFASGELSRFVSELDKDKDGDISEEEMKFYFYLVKLFHLCDQDQSGKIKHAELLVAMRDHADQFPEGFVEGDATRVGVSARLSTGDRDNDRLLTFGEFAHMTMFLNPEE